MGTYGCCGYTQDDFFVTTASTKFFLQRFVLQLWLTFLVTLLIHLYVYSNVDFIFLLITTLHCVPVDKSSCNSPVLSWLCQEPDHICSSFLAALCLLQSTLENTHSCRLVLITAIRCGWICLLLHPFCLWVKKSKQTKTQTKSSTTFKEFLEPL